MKTIPSALDQLDEEARKEFLACLALKNTHGLGARSICKLLTFFGNAYTALHSLDEWGKVSLGHKIEKIQKEEWRELSRREWDNSKDVQANIVLWTDDYYPQRLKEIPDAPPFFYCIGNKELLKNTCIALIGSRECSDLGQNEATYLAKALSSSGITVVSGMARGIDRAAHCGALSAIGSSIGVLGSGIDVIYPSRNSDIYLTLKEEGLLVSEFAPSIPPDSSQFPIRNRIISGLCLGVVVVEADLKSGSLITARLANEQGRNVYAIPGAMGSKFSLGCQNLIREGAKSVFRVEDILEDLLPLLKVDVAEKIEQSIKDNAVHEIMLNLASEGQIEEINQAKTKISKQEEQKVYKAQKKEEKESIINEYAQDSLEFEILSLILDKKLHIDEICEKLDKNIQEVTVCLVQLELQNKVERFEGAFFALA